MGYTKGKPLFSIEKPTKIVYGNEMLDLIEMSGRYIAELKIDEKRGMLCIEEGGNTSFWGYRGNKYPVDDELKETIRSFELPEKTILDGGFLKLKNLGDKPYLYIFDILVYDGEYVWDNFGKRNQWMNEMFETRDRFLRPIQITDFIEEFEALYRGESKLAEKVAQEYNIEYKLLEPLLEGFVLKDLNGTHGFPHGVKKSNNFYKLRRQDVIKGDIE